MNINSRSTTRENPKDTMWRSSEFLFPVFNEKMAPDMSRFFNWLPLVAPERLTHFCYPRFRENVSIFPEKNLIMKNDQNLIKKCLKMVKMTG